MTDLELMHQALDALENGAVRWKSDRLHDIDVAIYALRARLAQPEPEPVAWMWDVYNGAGYSSKGIGFQQTDIPFAKHTPLYTASPQRECASQVHDRREWQGLTDGEREAATGWSVEHIEAKLREKNT